jgi:phosphopantothenoylcysteine decarboxylase/phosphopantothenate--cysteine ligase
MYLAVKKFVKKIDVLIMAAAVSDFRPQRQLKKIRRKDKLNIRLYPTEDILKETKRINSDALRVGFALESNKVINNAAKKLQDKSLDLIVATHIGRGDIPFGEHSFKAIIIDRGREVKRLPSWDKRKFARYLIRLCEEKTRNRRR